MCFQTFLLNNGDFDYRNVVSINLLKQNFVFYSSRYYFIYWNRQIPASLYQSISLLLHTTLWLTKCNVYVLISYKQLSDKIKVNIVFFIKFSNKQHLIEDLLSLPPIFMRWEQDFSPFYQVLDFFHFKVQTSSYRTISNI